MPVRVVLADDHPVVRAGLRALLEADPGLTVVAEVGDRRGVTDAVRQLSPDVLVLDVTLADGSSLAWLGSLRTQAAGVRVLVLSMHDQTSVVRAALSAGASGYLVKEAAVEDLVVAVRAVAAGRTWLQPHLAAHLVATGPGEPLTAREREVLRLVAAGHTSAEAAAELFVGVRTVEAHRASVRRKTGASTRAELLAVARDLGLA